MGSLLTNNSAMIALQTLNSINRNLGEVQSQISTGLKVGTAKDNAAVFAISQVMRSDVAGFETLSEQLSLGESTVAVASNAAKSVGDLLNEIKAKIVSATGENVDRSKLQDEITSLTAQISSVVGAAQFNGLNLLTNTDATADGGSSEILSSLDRSSDQTVATSSISVAKQDLRATAGVAGTGTDISASAFAVSGAAAPSGGFSTLSVVGDAALTVRDGNRVLAGDTYTVIDVTGVTETIQYIAKAGDTVHDIASGLTDRINLLAAAAGVDVTAELAFSDYSTISQITFTNNTGNAILVASTLTTGGTASGGLETLTLMDVSTEAGAAAALGAVETAIQTVIDAQSSLGTSEKRVAIQNDFMSTLIDSFRAGIGSLVDADLEATSARLQSMQVQQQLGAQALSIANQAPQALLSLFR